MNKIEELQISFNIYLTALYKNLQVNVWEKEKSQKP